MARYTATDRFGKSTASATETAAGTVLKMPVQAAAAAADTAALKTQFDALLTKLKAAGLMSAS